MHIYRIRIRSIILNTSLCWQGICKGLCLQVQSPLGNTCLNDYDIINQVAQKRLVMLIMTLLLLNSFCHDEVHCNIPDIKPNLNGVMIPTSDSYKKKCNFLN